MQKKKIYKIINIMRKIIIPIIIDIFTVNKLVDLLNYQKAHGLNNVLINTKILMYSNNKKKYILLYRNDNDEIWKKENIYELNNLQDYENSKLIRISMKNIHLLINNEKILFINDLESVSKVIDMLNTLNEKGYYLIEQYNNVIVYSKCTNAYFLLWRDNISQLWNIKKTSQILNYKKLLSKINLIKQNIKTLNPLIKKDETIPFIKDISSVTEIIEILNKQQKYLKNPIKKYKKIIIYSKSHKNYYLVFKDETLKKMWNIHNAILLKNIEIIRKIAYIKPIKIIGKLVIKNGEVIPIITDLQNITKAIDILNKLSETGLSPVIMYDKIIVYSEKEDKYYLLLKDETKNKIWNFEDKYELPNIDSILKIAKIMPIEINSQNILLENGGKLHYVSNVNNLTRIINILNMDIIDGKEQKFMWKTCIIYSTYIKAYYILWRESLKDTWNTLHTKIINNISFFKQRFNLVITKIQEEIKAIVFDLDYTLFNVHTGGYVNKYSKIYGLYTPFKNEKNYNKLVYILKQYNDDGIKLYINTRGIKEEVIKYFKKIKEMNNMKINMYDLFNSNNIFGAKNNIDLESNYWNLKKINALDEISKNTGLNRGEILYLDDTTDYITKAVDNGYNAILVKNDDTYPLNIISILNNNVNKINPQNQMGGSNMYKKKYMKYKKKYLKLKKNNI